MACLVFVLVYQWSEQLASDAWMHLFFSAAVITTINNQSFDPQAVKPEIAAYLCRSVPICAQSATPESAFAADSCPHNEYLDDESTPFVRPLALNRIHRIVTNIKPFLSRTQSTNELSNGVNSVISIGFWTMIALEGIDGDVRRALRR